MRTFVEIPASNGKIKRIHNRTDGHSARRDERDDGFFEAGRQPHDARKARRQSRELMRRVRSGDDLLDLELDDLS